MAKGETKEITTVSCFHRSIKRKEAATLLQCSGVFLRNENDRHYTVNILPVFITVLISVNLQPRKVLVIFTAFPSTLTLSVKLGVQAKPVYITGKLTLLTNSYYCFFQ